MESQVTLWVQVLAGSMWRGLGWQDGNWDLHIFTEEMGLGHWRGDWDCDLGFEQNVSWEMGLNGNDRVLYAHSTSPHPGPSFSKGE